MLKRQKGQGVVEFALISPVLLLVILAIIETALIFQGYLTVQHAAREAARWAVTYKPDRGMIDETTPCDGIVCNPYESDQEYWSRRVRMIKNIAVDRAVGLRIDDTHLGLSSTDFDSFSSVANFYGVQVWGYPSFDEPDGGWTENDLSDHPGLPGLPVRVRVTHNVELLDPLMRAIVPRVRVVAQSEMINEGTQAGYGNVAPPALPPPPPLPSPDWEIGITDTPVPPDWASPTPINPDNTSTPTATPTPTPTGTPTATPTGPFIALSNYHVMPTQVILVDVAQHPSPGTYELRFVDASYNLVEVISAGVTVDGAGFARGIIYTIPRVGEGVYYVETDMARSEPVLVEPPAPDLVVRNIRVPIDILPNQEITVTMDVINLSPGFASGYFDVDLYVDPDYPPVTNRPGTSKQWLMDLGPMETKVITHVVALYGGGLHELWAQVDTSDWVPDELDEENNITGPLTVMASSGECSTKSDRFYGPEVDTKWQTTEWGAPSHDQWIEADETLSIQTSGIKIGSSAESATYLWQSMAGDFVATLKINSVPDSASWAKIGLMVRAGSSDDSAMATVARTRDNGLQFLVRPAAGQIASSFHGNVSSGLPVWVRLIRSGNAISAFYSGNGSNWVEAAGADFTTLPTVVMIGIAAASYSDGPAIGNVDDFEVCPIAPDVTTCQGYSDTFEADSTVAWTDADIGATAPGSSSRSGGTMTVNGNGASLWGSDNLHYTYQDVTGGFIATLKINSGATLAEWSKAGLMVRSSTAQDSAQVMVMKTRDHGLQFGFRDTDGGVNERFASDTEDGTQPVWVRIARNGNAFAAFSSTDGTNWRYRGSATAAMPETVLIGMAVSSYSSGQVDDANFDDFLFCAGDSSGVEPPLPPPDRKPPGLKECVQVIELGNFEASNVTPPWERNADVFHWNRRSHSGNFALELRAALSPPPEYRPLDPWAYQAVDVPGDVAPHTEGILSYWQYVSPFPEERSTGPDASDEFKLVIRDASGAPQSVDIPLATGDPLSTAWELKTVNVETYLTGDRIAEFAGDQMQIYFYGVHDADDLGTSFWIDDVRFDICTTEPIPPDLPDTASFGGLIEVLLNARPTKMPGIQVWAFAPGGVLFSTKTIHDSTYHFYNVPPGTYTIYAEVWTDGILYSSTMEVTVVTNERNYGVDMLLQ
jgi:regulation of enolase protein 1 (concanavalin A-like superfamily)